LLLLLVKNLLSLVLLLKLRYFLQHCLRLIDLQHGVGNTDHRQ